MNEIPARYSLILSHQQIQDILRRMAYQLWEQMYDASSIVMVAISPRGFRLACDLQRIWAGFSGAPSLEVMAWDAWRERDFPSGADVVLFDDVINTGVTMFRAMARVAAVLPRRLLIAVLVHRDHLRYPVHPEIVGYTLSTTYQEHIYVLLDKGNYRAVLA